MVLNQFIKILNYSVVLGICCIRITILLNCLAKLLYSSLLQIHFIHSIKSGLVFMSLSKIGTYKMPLNLLLINI